MSCRVLPVGRDSEEQTLSPRKQVQQSGALRHLEHNLVHLLLAMIIFPVFNKLDLLAMFISNA